jgi:hypothetical protein
MLIAGRSTMPTSLGNQDGNGLGFLRIFVIITALVLVIAGFIDIVF